jgi:hypothetical protein
MTGYEPEDVLNKNWRVGSARVTGMCACALSDRVAAACAVAFCKARTRTRRMLQRYGTPSSRECAAPCAC